MYMIDEKLKSLKDFKTNKNNTNKILKPIVMAYGRLNPPSSGHFKLVEKIHELSKKHNNADHELILSHSHDTEKNPLSQKNKIKHAKRFFPNTNIVGSSPENPSMISHAKRLNKAGYDHLIAVAGGDRIRDFNKVLNDYNGKEYNFKKITVVSSGKRDPKASGVEGMSASKMRGHAKNGNFKEFKKGIPPHVSNLHAKELYDDVRKGMSKKLHENFETTPIITEGVHDRGIFKAVFLAGGPGSGKDYILQKIIAGTGLKEIGSDHAFEYLMQKYNLSKKMPEEERTKRDVVRGMAKNITQEKKRLAIAGRLGLVINGTAKEYDKIFDLKSRFEELGYETMMVFVYTTDQESQKRNIQRGEHGGRMVPETDRSQIWIQSVKNLGKFRRLFGEDRFIKIDNSIDVRNITPNDKLVKEREYTTTFKKIKKFVDSEPNSQQAKEWIGSKKMNHYNKEDFKIGNYVENKATGHTGRIVSIRENHIVYNDENTKMMELAEFDDLNIINNDRNIVKAKGKEDMKSFAALAEETGIEISQLTKVYKNAMVSWRPGTKTNDPKTYANRMVEDFISKNKKSIFENVEVPLIDEKFDEYFEKIKTEVDETQLSLFNFTDEELPNNENVKNWAHRKDIQEAYIEKYGEENGRTKLLESANKMARTFRNTMKNIKENRKEIVTEEIA